MKLLDFEGIGRKMPKSTGVDATANNGAQAARRRLKKRRVDKNESTSNSILEMLKEGDKKYQQLVALQIFFDCGSLEEKQLAREALFAYVFPSNATSNQPAEINLTNSLHTSDDETEDNVDGEARASQFDDDDSSDSVLKSAVWESLIIFLLCI